MTASLAVLPNTLPTHSASVISCHTDSSRQSNAMSNHVEPQVTAKPTSFKPYSARLRCFRTCRKDIDSAGEMDQFGSSVKSRIFNGTSVSMKTGHIPLY